MKNNYKIKSIVLLYAILLVALVSCNKESEEGVVENDTFLLLSEEDSKLIDFSFETYSEMIASNPNVVMRLNMGDDGKLKVTYNKKDDLKYARVSSPSPELLCEDEEYSDEFADCVKKNVIAGICVTISTCAYCAHECDGGDNE